MLTDKQLAALMTWIDRKIDDKIADWSGASEHTSEAVMREHAGRKQLFDAFGFTDNGLGDPTVTDAKSN